MFAELSLYVYTSSVANIAFYSNLPIHLQNKVTPRGVTFSLFRSIYSIACYVKNGFTVDLQCTGTVKGYGYVATLSYRNALGMLYMLSLKE